MQCLYCRVFELVNSELLDLGYSLFLGYFFNYSLLAPLVISISSCSLSIVRNSLLIIHNSLFSKPKYTLFIFLCNIALFIIQLPRPTIFSTIHQCAYFFGGNTESHCSNLLFTNTRTLNSVLPILIYLQVNITIFKN